MRLAAINARAESELNDALAGVVGGEIESVHAAGAELSVLHAELMAIDFARSPRMLVEHPAGMPTAADARDAGIPANADDAAFGAALIAARDALTGVRAVYESLSVDNVSMAEATRFAEANGRLRDALAALETLDPSAIAVLENLPAIDQLVTEELVANARETLSFLGAFLAAAELAPGDGGEVATLIGAAASIATQSALSTLPSYSGILTSVGKSAIGMGILMAARGLIREAFPPALDGPEVIMVFGSAGGFVSPGIEWYAEIVNADLDIPSNNQMIIIPTTAADFLTEITGIAGDFNSALTAFDDHWLKRAKALYDAMNGLRDAADAAAGVGEGIVLTGQAVGSLNMIQFPAQTGFNCDGLVRNTYVVPVRLGVGFGEPYQVIVPAECSITGCPAGCEVGW